MKYKIEELKDITDSREILQSKQRGFSMYMTYIILCLAIFTIGWSLMFEKEVSTSFYGVIEASGEVTELCSDATGKISELNISDGQVVSKGDVLIKLNDSTEIITAPCDGTVVMKTDLSVGSYVECGETVASIVPGDNINYEVQVLIDADNIGKVSEGEEASIELYALSGSEYGYIETTLEEISLDTRSIESDSGSVSYYIAKCPINVTSLTNKDGESVDLKIGMNANVRIISKRETYFKYLLEKMDILD